MTKSTEQAPPSLHVVLHIPAGGVHLQHVDEKQLNASVALTLVAWHRYRSITTMHITIMDVQSYCGDPRILGRTIA